jgi:hypothetical protein
MASWEGAELSWCLGCHRFSAAVGFSADSLHSVGNFQPPVCLARQPLPGAQASLGSWLSGGPWDELLQRRCLLREAAHRLCWIEGHGLFLRLSALSTGLAGAAIVHGFSGWAGGKAVSDGNQVCKARLGHVLHLVPATNEACCRKLQPPSGRLPSWTAPSKPSSLRRRVSCDLHGFTSSFDLTLL